jgi:hypothetical protein
LLEDEAFGLIFSGLMRLLCLVANSQIHVAQFVEDLNGNSEGQKAPDLSLSSIAPELRLMDRAPDLRLTTEHLN